MKTLFSILISVSLLVVQVNKIYSQGLFDKLKDKVEEKIEKAVTNEGEEEEKKENNEQEVKEKNESSEQNQEETKPAKQELKSYSKYDFVPGDKVVFFEDFSQDNVSDFPALWNTNGSGEVITTNLYKGKWFRMNFGGQFAPDVNIPFVENFTLEFDIVFNSSSADSWNEGVLLKLLNVNEGWKVGEYVEDGAEIDMGLYSIRASSWTKGVDFFSSHDQDIKSLFSKDNKMREVVRVSVWVQKQRVRVYLDETKYLDIPKLLAPGAKFNKIQFGIDGAEFYPAISNIRIAVGLPDTRNKLLTEGKLVTHGILFDVNSDKIKPESYGTLKSIADVLKENADVKIKIVGHTDSDGSDAANLDLSKKRASSVKASLQKDFGIDASRMETDGKGESQPISDNNTPEGKANNRRVEFIKL